MEQAAAGAQQGHPKTLIECQGSQQEGALTNQAAPDLGLQQDMDVLHICPYGSLQAGAQETSCLCLRRKVWLWLLMQAEDTALCSMAPQTHLPAVQVMLDLHSALRSLDYMDNDAAEMRQLPC